jgi:cyclophilin family peptidyl-prolyl cis-trans isomerase
MLAGEHASASMRAQVAAALPARAAELARGTQQERQVIVEALRELAVRDPSALVAVRERVASPGWIACLLAPPPCSDLPDELRWPLAVTEAAAGGIELATRRTWLRTMLPHPDPRVRAAGLELLAAMWKEGDDSDHRTTVAQVAAALGSPDIVIAGAAVDAAGSLHETSGASPVLAPLDAALVARAARERDVELSASLYEQIGKHGLAAGADACRAGLDAPPVRARAAAECLRALGDAVPAPAIASAEPPPVDIRAVIGHQLRWHLDTTRGPIEIALDAGVAPWNVATIVALTQRHFFDGLSFHRVVPGFVVQGGDPTGSGAGGPGFMTPAEPASSRDTGGFGTGAVGIADAGRDSGGSQFFITHAPAHHLDGRYTWIGAVVRGQEAADALVIGDRIVRATVEIR